MPNPDGAQRSVGDQTPPENQSDHAPKREGPPGTVWGALGLAFTIITGAYCWLFKTWDKSEFPDETFQSPIFWWGMALLLALTGLYAIRVKTSELLDKILIALLCASILAAAGTGFVVLREGLPSSESYTIALFGFTGNGDALTNGLARRIRGAVWDQLQSQAKQFPRHLLILNRDRDPKGETEREQLDYIKKWAKRGKGSHLAIWLQVSMQPGGQYIATATYVKVSTFAEEIHDEVLGRFDSNLVDSVRFSSPNATNMPQDHVDELIRNADLFWGVACYRRADYETALAILPSLGTSEAEFYTGRSLYEKSKTSQTPRNLRWQEMSHLAKAIQLDPRADAQKALFYDNLSESLVSYVNEGLSQHAAADLSFASQALCQERQLRKILKDNPAELSTELTEAKIHISRASLLSSVAARNELEQAKRLASDARAKLGKDDILEQSDAENSLGNIASAEAEDEQDLQDALGHYQNSLRLSRAAKRDAMLVVPLMNAGGVEFVLAEEKNDRSVFEDAQGQYQEAAGICEQAGFRYCFRSHLRLCAASLDWATRLEGNTRAWKKEIAYARTECELASKYLTSDEVNDVVNLTYLQMSLVSKTAGDPAEVMHLVENLVADLTKGIDACRVDGSPEIGTLLGRRAVVYALLARLDPDNHDLPNLAKKDRDEARKHDQATPRPHKEASYSPDWAGLLSCGPNS